MNEYSIVTSHSDSNLLFELNTSVSSDSAKLIKLEFVVWFNSFFGKENSEENLWKDFVYIEWLVSFLWNSSTLGKRIHKRSRKIITS